MYLLAVPMILIPKVWAERSSKEWTERIRSLLQKNSYYQGVRAKLLPYFHNMETFYMYFNDIVIALAKDERIQDTEKQISAIKSQKSNRWFKKNQSHKLKQEKNLLINEIIQEYSHISHNDRFLIQKDVCGLVKRLIADINKANKVVKTSTTTQDHIAQNNRDQDTQEIKMLRGVLKHAIGETNYKEFTAEFFDELKSYDTYSLENVTDIITQLVKKYTLREDVDYINDLTDYLERMRLVKDRLKTDKNSIN